MKNKLSRSAGLILLGLAAHMTPALAHSWVEELLVIAPNGTFTGAPGYPRGNVLRTSPTFSDTAMVQLLPPDGGSNAFTTSMKLCNPSQTIGNQTAGSPALKASAGDMIALRYQENGHVTLPDVNPGKPANRGTIFIYGTTKPSNDDTYVGVKQWTTDGKGGDGRGVLLATRNYDDGQCYQVNSGTISTQRQKQFSHKADQVMGINMWCQSDVSIPSNVNSASYTLYWVWDWPTATGTVDLPNGKNQSYTTCMDVQLSSSNSGSSKAVVAYAAGQDLNSAAIQNQLTNAFLVPVTGAAAAAAAATGPNSGSSTATTPLPVAATTTNVQSNGNGNGGHTVTVTEQASGTVTVTHTVYATTPSSACNSQAVSVTPTSLTANSPSTSPSTGAAATSSAQAVPEGVNGGITVTPFLTTTSETPAATAQTTLATHVSASSSQGSPNGVFVTTVHVVDTMTIYSHVKPSQTSSVKIKGRWVVVSAEN